MNQWIDRHFRKYAVTNLSLIIIMCYGFGFLLQAVNSSFLDYLTLNTYAVLHGQIWRLLTWVLVPPQAGGNLFFILITMMFYYSIGTSLERTWGTWEYNKYIFSGLIFTVIGAFVIMALTYILHGNYLLSASANAYAVFAQIARGISTYYVGMSIFLAYAATFPEAQVLFMFLIPVKVKWLGIVYGAFIGIEFLQYAAGGYYYNCIVILASLLNFLIFWLGSGKMRRFSPKEMKRRADFKKNMSAGSSAGRAGTPFGSKAANSGAGAGPKAGSGNVRMSAQPARHRCAICGRTEQDAGQMEFRYCSRCEGSYEFCSEHLFTHVHAAAGKGPAPMIIAPRDEKEQ